MINKIKSPEIQEFIKLHQHDDIAMLMLNSSKYSHLPIKEIVKQIQSRQKAKQKLSEWYQHRDIIFPPPLSIEQSSSEITAKFKAKLVAGNSLIDLTGGTGIDTYYFSKVFNRVAYVEKNPLLCELAHYNFSVFSTKIKVNNQGAREFLSAMQERVDLIYLDPARRDDRHNKVFLLQDCEPDVVGLQNEMLSKADRIMIKTSPMLDINLADSALEHVKIVYIVAVGNEVKEVLYLLEKDYSGQVEIIAVNLNKNDGEVEEEFSFFKQEEQQAKSNFSLPLKYIYEPNSAVLKAGAFKLPGQRFNLAKLHLHSHLYTGDQLVPFPGRTFECFAVVPCNKKAVLPHLPEKKANITTRNFPDSVQTIRKKTGIKEGGSIFLFATTNMEDKLVVLICKKVLPLET